MQVNRRQALSGVAAAIAAASVASPVRVFAQAADGPFTLPPFGYAYEALEPNIDATTMMIHHQRHHGAFIGNLNNFAKTIPTLATRPVETVLADLSSIPDAARIGVRNNLGGHWNHTFFWELMTPGGAREPAGDLKQAIDSDLGGFAKVKEQVTGSGMSRFGSGWAWLAVDKNKKLTIVSTPNQDNPLMEGARGAVIGVDVWEHAYYLKYQNKRAEYLANWWNTVNWDKAAANYKKAMA